MISRRTAAFIKLCGLLRRIEENRDDLALVKKLNMALLKEILRDEAHILQQRATLQDLKRRLKKERPTREEARQLRKKIDKAGARIAAYFDQIFVWKSIGDGLAYAYISSFNIKHVFFDTTSMDPKPDPGFISGKAGLDNEKLFLLSAIRHGVPAVLCDITNVLRFGDICLLGASDPYPIEVKSRKQLNQRGQRQADKLEKLHKFLAEDYAADFRGSPEVRRSELAVPVRDHLDVLNDCIRSAKEDGYSLVCPEPGLTYWAIYQPGPLPPLDELAAEQPVVVILNLDKTDRNWAPYLPFVNSIRDPAAVLDFLTDKLTIVVAIELAVLCDKLTMPGWSVSFLEHHDLAILFEDPQSGARWAVSRQFFGRLAFEFLSVEWFAEHEKAMVTNVNSDAVAGMGSPVDGGVTADMTAYLDQIPKIITRSQPAQ
ncbi:hypothetical protein [Rhizobium leguminosarum]|uniref:hypothetical protein n=1 Tax=Rhizobium leguminosarum TaxID=384 RepID=UPI001C922FB4|nr:hypothetical protein [Rhizobium leguminosarum]MBY2988664.1 hypothetical protein [Rhizobium leguminosarum]